MRPPMNSPWKWLINRSRQRRERRDMAVLGAILAGTNHTIDIMKRIGMGSGFIMVSLARLESQGRIGSTFVYCGPGKPRRRAYYVADKQLDLAIKKNDDLVRLSFVTEEQP